MAELNARYATALFELSKERGKTSEYLEQAVFLRETLNDGDCKRIISHPYITAAEKAKFLSEAFAQNLHEDMMGFLRLAIDKNREAYIVPSLDSLINMIHEEQRKTTAKVISPVPLTEEQIRSLAEVLSRKLDKEVDVSVRIDPSVIGGIHIQADGFFIDRTVRHMLKEMKLSLKRSTANDSEA